MLFLFSTSTGRDLPSHILQLVVDIQTTWCASSNVDQMKTKPDLFRKKITSKCNPTGNLHDNKHANVLYLTQLVLEINYVQTYIHNAKWTLYNLGDYVNVSKYKKET